MKIVRPWHEENFREAVRLAAEHGVVASVKINAREYAGLRKFGRDSLDIMTSPEDLGRGHVAIFDGVLLCIDRDTPFGTIRFMDRDEEEIAHSFGVEYEEIRVHPGGHALCLDGGACLVQHVMNT